MWQGQPSLPIRIQNVLQNFKKTISKFLDGTRDELRQDVAKGLLREV